MAVIAATIVAVVVATIVAVVAATGTRHIRPRANFSRLSRCPFEVSLKSSDTGRKLSICRPSGIKANLNVHMSLILHINPCFLGPMRQRRYAFMPVERYILKQDLTLELHYIRLG